MQHQQSVFEKKKQDIKASLDRDPRKDEGFVGWSGRGTATGGGGIHLKSGIIVNSLNCKSPSQSSGLTAPFRQGGLMYDD